MNIFEITIQRQSKSGNWPIVVEQTSKGGQLPRRLDSQLYLSQDDLNRLHLSQFQAQAYGTLLGKALFQEQIRDAFVQAISNSPNGLRVLLFVEDEELKTLYWQRLCAPLEGNWQFLALHQRFPFSLYLPSSTYRCFPPIGKRDLRAIIVVASPQDLERYSLHPFDVQATVESVKTALGNIACDVLAFAEGSINMPTLNNFCQQLTQKHYTLLHIVCHGKFINGDTSLFWSTPDNCVERFTASEFLERLKRLRGSNAVPYFAFLSTCESATPEAETGLGGLGQRLVRELGMPAVVAMTQKVSINTASVLAVEFYQRLKLHGEVDLALVEATTTLAQQADILVPALFTRLRGQPLFSETLDRELTNEEIRYGLICLKPLLGERSPILLPQFEKLQKQLQTTLETEPQFLSLSAQEERQQGLTELNRLCYQVLDISFNALAFDLPVPTYDSRCPFQGLYAFKIEDQEFFFGRELLIENLKKRLTEHPFLAVVGNSGCGKSSLVLAGLIPALQKQQTDLKVAYLTPKSDPIAQLNASFSQVQDSSFIIVVDQFEELFTLCKDELQRVNFIQELVKSSSTQKIVVTLRADFWGECAVYPELRELMETHQALIPPLNVEELGRVMEQQATHVRLRFEAGLRDLMLQDVAGEPGAMPLLQHALWQLWRRRHGRWLLCDEYQEIGKVQEAIAKTADDFYNQLSPQEQEQVRNIFIRLTRLDDCSVRSEQHRDTRRRVLMGELVPLGSDVATIKDLVRRLADERLVVTSVDGVTGREEVEVVHEALIQYWSRLQGWLNEDRENLQLRERIRQQALDWQLESKDELLLLQGGRLEDAIALSKHQPAFFNQLEDGYVKGCLGLRERKRRQEVNRLRKWVAALSVSLVVAVGAGGVAFNRYQEAKKQATLANLRLDAAKVKELLNSDPVDAMVLAIKATGQSYEVFGEVLPEVQSSLYAAIDVPVESRIFEGNGRVTSVAYSLDGQMIASTREDGTIELLDLQGRLIVPAFKGHGGTVRSLAFNPKKEIIATGNDDGTIEFWNLQGRPIIPPFKGHEGRVLSLAFSPNGERLASGGEDTKVRLWDIQGKTIQGIGQPLKHDDSVYSLAFSPNGKIIASGSYDKKLRLWNLQGTFQLLRPPIVNSEAVYAVAFHPDGNSIATGNAAGKIQFWNLQGQAINPASPRHDESVFSLAYSPDGSKLVSGSRDNTIRLWDRQGNPIGQPLRGHKRFVRSVAFSPNGEQIISGGVDGTVRLWNVPKNNLILRQPLKSAIESVAVSPDGQIIAGASADGMIFLWNQDGTLRCPPLKGHDGRVQAIAFSPDGTKIVTGSYDQTLRLWKTNGESIKVKFPKHTDSITAVAFSPNGEIIATGTWDGKLYLWSVKGKLIVPPRQADESIVYAVAFSPKNNLIASGGGDGKVKLWDMQGIPKGSFLASQFGVSALAFDSQSQKIITANGDRSLKLWDLNGKLISHENSFQGHLDVITSVMFGSSDQGEQVIVTGSKDNTLRLWDLQGNQIGVHAQGDDVTSVAITPDGRKIISSSADGTLMLWEGGNWRIWFQRVCNQIQNHSILQPPQTPEAQKAKAICKSRVGTQDFIQK